MKNLVYSFVMMSGLFAGSIAFADSCTLPNGTEGITATYVGDDEVLVCVPNYYSHLVGGKIDPDRLDVCKDQDEFVAVSANKAPFTVNGSSFCLDARVAVKAQSLVLYTRNH